MRNIKVPLTLIDLSGDGYHLFVSIHIFGKECLTVVDTGASRSVFDKHFLDENMSNNTKIVAASTVTLFTTSSTMQGLIPKFKIGKLAIRNFPIIAMDLNAVNDAYAHHNHGRIVAILGSDIFHNHQARINYKKLTIHFSTKKMAPWS